MQQRTWEEETGRLNKEIKRLQSQIEQEVAMQVLASFPLLQLLNLLLDLLLNFPPKPAGQSEQAGVRSEAV